MPVTLSLPTVLARLTDGQATLEANGTTVGEVVTGASAGGLEAPVNEGDEITVVIAVAGG